MEFTKTNFTFLLLGIVGFLLMPLLEAATFSCDLPTELYVGSNKTTVGDTGALCRDCWSTIQTSCNSKGRPVSKINCNWWDIGRRQATTVCVGCCGAPHPPPLPVITSSCDAGDTDLTFGSPMTSGSNCGVCQNGCKTKCDAINGTVTRETCRFLSTGGPRVTYYYGCYCCCTPPPPPSPSPPPPSPPPPSPSPPPPSPPPPSPSPPPPSPPPPSSPPPPKKKCNIPDIYRTYDASDCSFCEGYCSTVCTSWENFPGISVGCIASPTYVTCECCCLVTGEYGGSLIKLFDKST